MSAVILETLENHLKNGFVENTAIYTPYGFKKMS